MKIYTHKLDPDGMVDDDGLRYVIRKSDGRLEKDYDGGILCPVVNECDILTILKWIETGELVLIENHPFRQGPVMAPPTELEKIVMEEDDLTSKEARNVCNNIACSIAESLEDEIKNLIRKAGFGGKTTELFYKQYFKKSVDLLK